VDEWPLPSATLFEERPARGREHDQVHRDREITSSRVWRAVRTATRGCADRVTSPCTLDLDLTSTSSGCVNAGAAPGAIRGKASSGEGEVAPLLHAFAAGHHRNGAPGDAIADRSRSTAFMRLAGTMASRKISAKSID